MWSIFPFPKEFCPWDPHEELGIQLCDSGFPSAAQIRAVPAEGQQSYPKASYTLKVTYACPQKQHRNYRHLLTLGNTMTICRKTPTERTRASQFLTPILQPAIHSLLWPSTRQTPKMARGLKNKKKQSWNLNKKYIFLLCFHQRQALMGHKVIIHPSYLFPAVER